eukprot:5935375-Pyramimonas_sp.AAC.1
MSFQRAVQTGCGIHALANILSAKLPKLKTIPPPSASSAAEGSPDAEHAAVTAWLSQVSPAVIKLHPMTEHF